MDIKRRAYLKSFIFGVEDSLVSTVGLLSGVVLAGAGAGTAVLTGIVLIFVEGFSMSAGEFLSESEVEEATSAHAHFATGSALIMFASYVTAGFVPLFPYFIFPVQTALLYSIAAALIALAFLGALGARLSNGSYLKHALRMLIVGGAAILIGVLAGQLAGGL